MKKTKSTTVSGGCSRTPTKSTIPGKKNLDDLQRSLFFPQSPKRKGIRQVNRTPFMLTSRAYQIMFLAEKNKKEEKEREKEEKKTARLQKREKKLEENEIKKKNKTAKARKIQKKIPQQFETDSSEEADDIS